MRRLVFLAVLVVGVTGCGATPSVTPSPATLRAATAILPFESSPTATAPQIPATSTAPLATATPRPTDTRPAPTATAQPMGTATPKPTDTRPATATPASATATPTPPAPTATRIPATPTQATATRLPATATVPARSSPTRSATATPAEATGATACPQGCTAPSANCRIKGNINSDGEKIYHMPGQRYYEDTVISPEKGERWFCTEDEAVKNGWRKSKV